MLWEKGKYCKVRSIGVVRLKISRLGFTEMVTQDWIEKVNHVDSWYLKYSLERED